MKKVLIVAGIAVIAYTFGFVHSLRNIDEFCNSVSTETKVSDLKEMAESAGVDLRGPVLMSSFSGRGGEFVYAEAASAFTVGEYACSIRAASFDGTVQKKHLGYMGH
jgi:hypothetical protein